MSQSEFFYLFFFFSTSFLTVISICLWLENRELRRENAELTAKLAEYVKLIHYLFK